MHEAALALPSCGGEKVQERKGWGRGEAGRVTKGEPEKRKKSA